MMDLRYAPYQRKKSSRKGKSTTITLTRPRSEGLRWTSEEDSLLRDGVCKFGGKKWKTISEHLERRTPEECNKRWNKLQSLDSVVKRPWTQEEDAQMFQLVKKYGASKWAVIASYLLGRNGKQCRERWHNQLNPTIKKTPWTEEENSIILNMQAQFGNCWAKITSQLPGRTDNAVKNHWHSSLKLQANRARGDSGDQSTKRTKTKKLRKTKTNQSATKQCDGFFPCVDFPACTDAASDPGTTLSGGALNGADMVATSIPSDDPSMVDLDSVVDFFDKSIIHDNDSGSFSPDVVSSVDSLDLYTYAHSYQENVLRAQAVIDNILDPMGMDSCTGNSSSPLSLSDVSANRATNIYLNENLMDAWFLNNDDVSPDDELYVDPTSPAQVMFDLDELLYDSLHDANGDDALQETTEVESSNLVLSLPLGEVARVYQRSGLDSDWGPCGTNSSSIASTTGSVLTPVSTNVAPDLLPVDDMLIRRKDETLFDGVNHEHSSQKSGHAQHYSALASLLDVEV